MLWHKVIGAGGAGGPSDPLGVFVYRETATTSSTGAVNTYTFNNLSIGSPSSYRKVFYVAVWENSAFYPSVTSASIGGVSFSNQPTSFTGGAGLPTFVGGWTSSAVTSGTTANFTINFSSNINNGPMLVAIYTIDNVSSMALSSADSFQLQATAPASSLTINQYTSLPNNAGIIGLYTQNGGSAASFSGAGALDEAVSIGIYDGGPFSYFNSSGSSQSASTTISFSPTAAYSAAAYTIAPRIT